jgi:large subunit ribosomal protein L37Ae
MARRTRQAGSVARFGPRYGVRIRRRVQEVEEAQRARHVCPNCEAPSVQRTSTGVWTCRRCGYTFAGGAYRPIVTTSFKREVVEEKTAEAPEPAKPKE